MLIGKTFSDGWRHGARDGYRPPVSAQQKSVAVTAIVEHPALDAVRDGAGRPR